MINSIFNLYVGGKETTKLIKCFQRQIPLKLNILNEQWEVKYQGFENTENSQRNLINQQNLKKIQLDIIKQKYLKQGMKFEKPISRMKINYPQSFYKNMMKSKSLSPLNRQEKNEQIEKNQNIFEKPVILGIFLVFFHFI